MENYLFESDPDSGYIPAPIPEPTLRRLPLYHNYLKKLDGSRFPSISCTKIAEDLKLTPIQVRKDLAFTGIVGKPKTGYEVAALCSAIESFLGWNNTKEAMLFGAGHLGLALLSYAGFANYGLEIVAALDPDPAKQGPGPRNKEILPLKKGADLIRRMHIKIAIIAVPEAEAQATADLSVSCGIKAIWNFAPVKIAVPAGVIVQHENLASSLAVLSKKLTSAVPEPV
jgi:redox-sensing transcriptional repressor